MNVLKTVIQKHEMVSKNYLLIETKADISDNLGLPGQFYELKAPSECFQLRIPISIYNAEGQIVSFLIKIVGERTKQLQQMRVGDELDMIGPLGNTFKVEENKKYLFITGGVGFAPLHYLYRHSKNNDIIWIHGGRDREEVNYIDDKHPVIICTDDGSVGRKGFVTEFVKEALAKTTFHKVYACGPVPMMKAVVEICKVAELPLIVSLEEYMGCGVGVCHGCAVKLRSKSGAESYVRVCKAGPVFDAKMIAWE